MRKKYLIVIIVVLMISIFLTYFVTNYSKESKSSKPNNIKYVFLFIGDGMSLPEIDMTEIYNNRVKENDIDNQEQLTFTKFETIGLRKNQSGDSHITDSSSSASALASGKLIRNGMLNIDKDGNKIEPITYELKKNKKMKIGIITNQGIDHATPAGFYATSTDRNNYQEIALQIPKTGFDFFAGSQVYGYSASFEGLYKENNYKYISTKEEYKNISNNGKYIVISPSYKVNFGMEQKSEDVSISTYLKTALKVLDNNSGFFVMVESGLIDSASHNNDLRAMLSEVNELDKAVKIALEFAEKHKDKTLIIVTGDHETGSLSLGSDIKYENLNNINMSLKTALTILEQENISNEEKINTISNNFSINKESDTYQELIDKCNNKKYDEIINILRVQEFILSGASYSSYSHTGLSVPVYVYGDKNNIFTGEYTTDIFNKKLRNILGLK